MSEAAFSRMFNPRGIAVVGANTDITRPGRQTVDALERHGYKGRIYPVNPKYERIGEQRCLGSIDDIDGPCDVAVIALPAALVPGALEQCGRKKIGYAVVVGGGFREMGQEGEALERKMLDAARAGNMRIIGPNCLGYVNIHDRVFGSFGSITRPPDLEPGPVSAVIQSGGFGNSMVIQASSVGIGFRYLVASGGESDIKVTELIDAFVDDRETKVILAYLEGVQDGRAFMAAARRALAAGKPLLVVKAGNTDQGKRMAASHTAFMTASYDVYKAAFKQCGVIEARDIGDAVDILQGLVGGRFTSGRNVAVMSGSGGSLVSFSDAADDHGLMLGTLTEETRSVLKANLPSIASINNPIDCTAGFHKKANAERFQSCIEALLTDPGIDQLGLFMATAGGPNLVSSSEAIVASRNPFDKPIYAFSALPPHMTVEGRAVLKSANIPVYGTPRRMAAVMRAMADFTVARERKDRLAAEYRPPERPRPALPRSAGSLDEHAAKRVLAEFGIAVTRDVLLPADSKVTALPDGMQFPVAVKIVSGDIAHKTDIGAVKLNVSGNERLAAAAAEVVANARKAAPQAKLAGVLVSEMVTDGIETIVGVVNDPAFGPVVAFGLGGIFAETLRDTTYRIAPFDVDTAREMIGELRGAALFGGLRGQSPRDTEALAATLARVSELAWLLRDSLAEMDINPVLVRPQGRGVAAADALIVLR
jgi:acetate---CoA ligase (ADP-forming)